MLSYLSPEVVGLAALLALVLLPGLVVVRAPWTVVPALSVAFWTLSWWWLPMGSRTRVLGFALAALALLAAFRLLPKHVVPPPPSYDGPPPPPPVTGPLSGHTPRLRSGPSLVVVAVALALLAPLVLLSHAPGQEMAFHTTAARLAFWRDALPTTYEPLLPLAPFGAHAPALPTLAADVSLLSGLGPGRSVALVTLGAVALLLLALFALFSVRLRAPAAALAALLGLAAVRWPGFLAMWGEGGPLLALALGASATALLLGHTSRPSAVAAGMLLAAAALAQPVLTLGVAAAVTVAVLRTHAVIPSPSPGAEKRGHDPIPGVDGRESGSCPRFSGRLGLALGVAVVLASPGLWRLVPVASAGEAWAAVSGVALAEVVDFVMGLALLVVVVILSARLTDADSRGGSRVRAAVLTGLGAVLLLVRVSAGLGAGQVDPGTLSELEALERQARPLEAVCAPEDLIGWVPALAGRAPGRDGLAGPEPWAPHVLREEWRRRRSQPCFQRLN